MENVYVAFVGNVVPKFLCNPECITRFKRSDASRVQIVQPRTRYFRSRARFHGKLGSTGNHESDRNENENESAESEGRESVENPGQLFSKLEDARKKRKEVSTEGRGVDTKLSNGMNNALNTNNAEVYALETIPEGLQSASRALWRVGWVVWWLQLILTVIAAVILLFTFLFPGINVRTAASAVGFAVSGAGIVFAFLSLFWTYGYTRLALWLREKQTLEKAQLRIHRRLRFGLLFSITGIVILLVGLQAIVGTLLARLLGTGIASPNASQNLASGVMVSNPGLVQPVDILVVQACANGLTGMMIALVATVWFRAKEKKWISKSAVSKES